MNETDEGDDFEGAFHLANTITGECKQAMEDHTLELALALLAEAAGGVSPPHDFSMSKKTLALALCIRYTRYGFPEDVFMSAELSLSRVGPSLSRPTVDRDTEDEEDSSSIELALELIDGYCQSASIENLNNAAYLYEIALSSSPLTHPARLSMLLAAADNNCLRNVIEDNPDVLDLAVAQLEEALQLAWDEDSSITFCCLVSLGNTYCMRWLLDCNLEYARQALEYLEQAQQLDEEAASLQDSGMINVERFDEGRDARDLELAITQFKQSVLRRQCPHPRLPYSLNSLAVALGIRFDQQRNFADLEESIKHHREALRLFPSPRSDRSSALNGLANALLTRFECQGVLTDLEESIEHHREALGLCPSPHPHRSASLNNLAKALGTRFERQDVLEDLEESIGLHREALGLRPFPHPDRSTSLNQLANVLTTRFERQGVGSDLEESIEHYYEALELRPSPHPNRSSPLTNLATALCIRFEWQGVLADLEKSINFHREALGLRPSPHPDRPKSLNGLANALTTRFKWQGVLADLEESIYLHRETLGLRPFPHPDRSSSLNNLFNALRTRFERQGVLADLEECIIHQREALGLLPFPHPYRSGSLNNLATALSTHFEWQGVPADLEESINLHREALGLRPSPHPDRPSSLNNLATALTIRFEWQGIFVDLDESINLHREALGLLLSSHPERSNSLNNLATALNTRFEWRGILEDLEESINIHREALGLRPFPHPDRSISLSGLANALTTHFQSQGVIADLEESINLHREALGLRLPPHTSRADSLNGLANALGARFERRGVLSDLEESIEHRREALGLFPSPHPNRSVALHNLAMALLAYGTQNRTEAFSLFEQSASYPYGSLFGRLQAASGNWARSATRLKHPSALSAYQCAVHLLLQLASIHLDSQHRQDVLVHAKDLASNATRCAIEAGKYEDAVVFSSTARAVFWSQSLQLRNSFDELQLVSPQLAEKLQFLGRALEKRNLPGAESTGTAGCANLSDKYASYFRGLAEDWQQTLEKVREHPGFEDFLKPPSFSSLRDCSKSGSVVLLNASARGCDALVLTQDSGPRHIPLRGITLGLLLGLSDLLHHLIRGKTPNIDILSFLKNRGLPDCRKLIRLRQACTSPEDRFSQLLGILWDRVVFPVIDFLKLVKSATPMTRIWWCPSGAFSFLPIHAAGIYSGANSDCLHDYAISSYCSSLQSLLTPITPIEPDYKFLAIIQPEAPGYGASPLPMTKVELEKIEAHLPQPHSTHLLKHVGVARSPTSVDDVLSDLQHASFVHFGCHGAQEPNPLESCLLLSGGRLTMSSILQCQAPKASLAYLSACQTAKHDNDRPDESLHLAATMMFAGFRSVVATLWSIYDHDAPIVADVFYGHLFRHGSTKAPDITESAYALHLGVKALRDRGVGFRHWVPFVHYGL